MSQNRTELIRQTAKLLGYKVVSGRYNGQLQWTCIEGPDGETVEVNHVLAVVIDPENPLELDHDLVIRDMKAKYGIEI